MSDINQDFRNLDDKQDSRGTDKSGTTLERDRVTKGEVGDTDEDLDLDDDT